MMIEFQCECGRPYRVGPELAGKKAQCKSCGRIMRIPVQDKPEPESDVYGLEIALEDSRSAPPVEIAQPPRISPPRVRPAASKSSKSSDRKPPPKWLIGSLVVVSLYIMLNTARRRLALSFVGPSSQSLTEARRGFGTSLVRRESAGQPVDNPPPWLFRTVRYVSPAGPLAAYLSVDPGDGRKYPAILWITGGDCNTIDQGVWAEADPSNDQTASAFRKAGIVMMFPSLRGGNDNPGPKEGFFGEVNDVLAAAEFLARVDYVDPACLYLGGHSTGGTLVLLVAASSDRFRGVFSFGPVDDVSGYGSQYLPFNTWNRREIELRSPIYRLHSVRSPTFVFEGSGRGNLASLQAMSAASSNPLLQFHSVQGANHFSILEPTTRTIAAKILRDKGPKTNITFTANELDQPFGR